jgi:signal transduction histidine kinase
MELNSAGSLLGVASAFLAVLAAVSALALCRRRESSVHLPLTGLAVASLAVTAAHVPFGDGGPTTASWGLVEIAGLLALVVALVRRSRPRTAAWVGALAGTAVALTLVRVRAIESPADLLLCLFWVPFVLAAAAAGWYLRAQDTSHRREVMRVHTEQRLALAADLHDFVAHEVSAILFQAQAARMLDPDVADAAGTLELIEGLSHRALASLDRSVQMLRDPDEDQHGLSQVRLLAQQFSAIGPVSVDLHVDPSAEGCSEEAAATAYRIVVEALTNVRRHAPTSTEVTVDIRPAQDPATLEIVVENITADIPVASRQPPRVTPAGSGIAALTARVVAQGGTLTAGPRGDDRWRLAAVLPAGRA